MIFHYQLYTKIYYDICFVFLLEKTFYHLQINDKMNSTHTLYTLKHFQLKQIYGIKNI
jgi:hypothetical protein